MKTMKMTIAVMSIFLLIQCQQADYSVSEGTTNYSEAPDSEALTSSTGNADKDRKFIRTADLKFKVHDVSKATENIENITLRNNGFVTYTHLSSDVTKTNTTAISKDSSLLTTYYNVTNTITIRVPNSLLDTTLRAIAQHIDFLDFRLIKAEDVALQMLANQLTQKRNSGNDIQQNSKVKSSIMADEHNIRKKELSDEAKIANLSLNDKVNYSTIQLSLYQNPTIKRELIANEKNLDAYKPGLGSRLIESFKTGWDIIEHILVFITQFWAFFLIGILLYFLYKKYIPHITDKNL